MKRPRLKSKGVEVVAVPQPAATSVASQEPKKEETVATPVASVTSSSEWEPPDPEYLLHMAEAEPNKELLGDYIETIQVLRDDKDFSFRQIAEWLCGNGVPTDHNAVYREYMHWARDPQAYDLEREHDAMERAQEDAELGR
jgi:hypothetical protein